MAAAVAFVAKAATAFFTAKGVVIGIIRAIAVNLVVSAAARALFKPDTPPSIQSIRGHQVTTRGGLEYRKIVYGQAMVSGPVAYNNVSGTNNEYIWYVIPLVGHEIEDLVSIWLDSEEITKAQIDWTAGTGGADGTGTGDVSKASFIGSNSTKAVAAWYYLGHADQVVSGALNTAFADINTTHRLRGIAYIIVRFLFNADTEEIWQRGVPTDIKAVIKGRKVYDPRLDSTNGGVGAHRYTDASTWEYSDTPWLGIADYLVNYLGADPADEMNWTTFADGADHDETTVAIPTSSTEQRFTLNGALSEGSSHRINLQKMLSSNDGRVTNSGGEWSARASEAVASTTSIVASDIMRIEQIEGMAPESRRVNTYRGFFADPDRNYEPAEFPHVSVAAYVTRDNGQELSADLELPFTNSATMAQRIAFRLLNQGDKQISVTLKLGPIGWAIAAGDTVDITLDEMSWDAKLFRALDWERNLDGSFTISFIEDATDSYDDPAELDYLDEAPTTITLPADVVPPPSDLTAVTVPVGIRLDWTNPPTVEFDWIDVYESEDSAWSNAVLIASTRASTYNVPRTAGEQRWYWIRARRNAGDVSLRDPDSDTSTVTNLSGQSTGISIGEFTSKAVFAFETAPTDASASFRCDSDGDLYGDSGSGYISLDTWIGNGANTEYECRLTKDSGTDPTGDSLATWLACSSDRTWTLTETGTGSTTASCTFEIRRTSDNEVLASVVITLTALVSGDP